MQLDLRVDVVEVCVEVGGVGPVLEDHLLERGPVENCCAQSIDDESVVEVGSVWYEVANSAKGKSLTVHNFAVVLNLEM